MHIVHDPAVVQDVPPEVRRDGPEEAVRLEQLGKARGLPAQRAVDEDGGVQVRSATPIRALWAAAWRSRAPDVGAARSKSAGMPAATQGGVSASARCPTPAPRLLRLQVVRRDAQQDTEPVVRLTLRNLQGREWSSASVPESVLSCSSSYGARVPTFACRSAVARDLLLASGCCRARS